MWDCFGKNIYLFLDRIKKLLHFREIPQMNGGIGTKIEKNLCTGDIKMVPNDVLFKATSSPLQSYFHLCSKPLKKTCFPLF